MIGVKPFIIATWMQGMECPGHRAVRTLGHKLIYFDQPRNAAEEENRWELFDMARDPQEMRNVAT